MPAAASSTPTPFEDLSIEDLLSPTEELRSRYPVRTWPAACGYILYYFGKDMNAAAPFMQKWEHP